MKIRKIALAYCLLAATVGSSATALAVVPNCTTKVVWVMKRVKNTVSKATLDRWKAWGIKHPNYKPPVTSRRPLYKSAWVRGAADQFTCFPEGVSLDLWTDTTNADTEVAQLDLLPEVLMPSAYGRSPSSSSIPGGTTGTSTTAIAGPQDIVASEYYPVVPIGGIGGGFYYFPYGPGSGTGSGTAGTPITTLPPTSLPPTTVSGTTIGTPIAPAITPEPASLLLLATGLFGMALVLTRFGGSSLLDAAVPIQREGSGVPN